MGLGVTPSRPPGLGQGEAGVRTAHLSLLGVDCCYLEPRERRARSLVWQSVRVPARPSPNPPCRVLSQRDVPTPPVQLRIGGIFIG
jgi:hypothetical protein